MPTLMTRTGVPAGALLALVLLLATSCAPTRQVLSENADAKRSAVLLTGTPEPAQPADPAAALRRVFFSDRGTIPGYRLRAKLIL